jgi:serine/threonine-protein kinase
MPTGMLGPYRLMRTVASGGMGVLHEAFDDAGQRRAVRALPADGLPAGAAERERLRTAALAATELQHPGIVELHDFGWDGDTAYVATAFVEGETLAQYLARAGRLPALHGLALALQLLAALAAAHARGLVHSALNPQHVLMGRNGQLRIGGFGWVAAVASASRRPGVFDVPAYMAPEQILGRPADIPADLYSAAVLAYELLAGSWPYQAHAAPRPPRALRRDLPVALDAVFERAQAQSPQARYASAAEFAAALQAAFGTPVWERAVVPVRRTRAVEPPPEADLPVEARTEPEPETEAPQVRRGAVALLAGLAAAVVLGATFAVVEGAREAEPMKRIAAPAPVTVPTPVVAAPAAPAPPPPALPPVEAVPAAASIEPVKKPDSHPQPQAAPVPARAKPAPADPRPRKAVERPAEPAVREIVVAAPVEAPPVETVPEPPPPPRPREPAERPAPQRTAAIERPARPTAVMAAPPSPSPLNVCRQEFSMARELCVAYECATSEYRHHPVCVRMHADAIVRHKLNQRNGP